MPESIDLKWAVIAMLSFPLLTAAATIGYELTCKKLNDFKTNHQLDDKFKKYDWRNKDE